MYHTFNAYHSVDIILASHNRHQVLSHNALQSIFTWIHYSLKSGVRRWFKWLRHCLLLLLDHLTILAYTNVQVNTCLHLSGSLKRIVNILKGLSKRFDSFTFLNLSVSTIAEVPLAAHEWIRCVDARRLLSSCLSSVSWWSYHTWLLLLILREISRIVSFVKGLVIALFIPNDVRLPLKARLSNLRLNVRTCSTLERWHRSIKVLIVEVATRVIKQTLHLVMWLIAANEHLVFHHVSNMSVLGLHLSCYRSILCLWIDERRPLRIAGIASEKLLIHLCY